jgi:hypothetical protein
MLKYTSELVSASEKVVGIAKDYEMFIEHLMRIIELEDNTPHGKLDRVLGEIKHKLGR